MKTILAILMVTLILLLGCDTSPDLLVNNLENDFSKSSISLTRYVQIPLPNKSPLWADSIFTMSQIIDGSVGGRMIMQKYYISDAGDSVIINSDLRIPAGAFQGTETITMTVDDEFACNTFLSQNGF